MSETPAVLRAGSQEVELPAITGSEGERGVDISKLRARPASSPSTTGS